MPNAIDFARRFNFGFLKTLGGLFAIATGGLACISAVSFNTTNQLVETDRWVIHTYQVLAQFELVNSIIKDAERNQRSYLLIGDPKYIEAYQEAAKQTYQEIENLRELVQDNPGQSTNVESLRFFADERIQLIRYTLNLSEQGRRSDAINLIDSGQGDRAMGQVQSIVEAGKQQEEQLLKVRMESARLAVQNQRYSTFALFFVVLLILVGAYQLVGREVDRRRKAEEEALEAQRQAVSEREKLMLVMQTGIGLTEIQDGIRRGEDRVQLFREIDRLIEQSKN